MPAASAECCWNWPSITLPNLAKKNSQLGDFGSSEQLGEFIQSLVEEGSVETSSRDRRQDFQGWYDLEQDPATWKLQW